MAKVPITTLTTNANTFLADNESRQISAADVRNRVHEIIAWLDDIGGLWYIANTANSPPTPEDNIYRTKPIAIGEAYDSIDAASANGLVFLGDTFGETKLVSYDNGPGGRAGVGHLAAVGDEPPKMTFTVDIPTTAHVFKVTGGGQERMRLLNNYVKFTGFGAGDRDDSVSPNSYEINNIAYFGPMGELAQAPITKLPGNASNGAEIFDLFLDTPGNPTVSDVEDFVENAGINGPTFVFYVGSGSSDEPQAIFLVDAGGNAKKINASGASVGGLTFQGDYNPTTDTPDLTDAGGSSGDYYRVTKPASEQVVDFGSGGITFPANTGGELIHDGSVFRYYPDQEPSATSEEYVTRTAGQVAQLGYINKYPSAHVFDLGTEAPTVAANRAFSVKIDGVITLWTPNAAVDDWEPNAVEKSRPVLTTSSAHGLTSGDIGKPITSDGAIWDETRSDSHLIGILTLVPSTTTLTYAPTGDTFDVPKALISGGASWDVDDEDEGRYLDWDKSLGLYVGQPPTDIAYGAPQPLAINRLDSTTFNCTVI